MNNNNTIVGYLVGGIPLLIGGMSLIRAVEWFGLPPVIAGIGVVTAVVGVAETLGTICQWVFREGKKYVAATSHPREKRQRQQSLHGVFMSVICLSGPIYRQFKASASGLDPEGEADDS